MCGRLHIDDFVSETDLRGRKRENGGTKGIFAVPTTEDRRWNAADRSSSGSPCSDRPAAVPDDSSGSAVTELARLAARRLSIVKGDRTNSATARTAARPARRTTASKKRNQKKIINNNNNNNNN